MIRMNLLSIATLAMFVSSQAWSAGFEKATLWSARYAPVGAAATSIVNDAEALYFNPAGLSAAQPGWSLSANFSPTLSQFKAPVLPGGAQVSADQGFSPIYGTYASYKMDNGFAFGFGSGVAGGTISKYDDITVGAFTLQPTIETKLTILEHSVGGSYEIMEGLRLGAAWRVVQVSGTLTAFSVAAGPTLVFSEFRDVSKTEFGGFKVGAQYSPRGASWGLGLNFRNSVDFVAETDTVRIRTQGGTNTDSTVSGTIANTFPLQLSLGGYKALDDSQLRRIVLEWTFTRYALNRELTVSNAATGASTIPQNWRNQHNLRVGYDFTPTEGLAYRAGYILTSQVTPDDRARPGFASPGLGHTALLGGGWAFSQNWSANLGLEYSFAKGDGSTPAATPVTGTFQSASYAAHVGTTLRF